MTKFRMMLCGIAMTLAACGVSTTVDDSTSATSQDETVQVSTFTRGVGAAAETCTETDGPCKVGGCELGPHDTFQAITEVCCTAAGVCETERYRLCGC